MANGDPNGDPELPLSKNLVNRVLTLELLGHVFAAVPFDQRHSILPLVCWRWRHVCNEPSLWSVVEIDLEVRTALEVNREDVLKAEDKKFLSWARLLRWFVGKCMHIRDLRFVNFTQTLQRRHDCPVGGAASILGLLSRNLTSLSIVNCTAAFFVPGDMVHLVLLQQVTQLTISELSNPIKLEEMNNLGYLTTLEELHILFQGDGTQQNLLRGFPVEMTALSRLRMLELTSAGPDAIPTLPEGITAWRALNDLQLYRCGLRSLPEELGALKTLSTLLLEGASSTDRTIELPASLSSLTSLKRIVLSGWSFEDVPAHLYPLNWVQEIDLSFNPLGTLPDILASWYNLQNAKLNCCEFSEVPEVLCMLSSLRQLDLAYNDSLAQLPPGVYLRNLLELDISRCNFASVPFALREASSLRSLDISYNEALQIDSDATLTLASMPNIRLLLMKKARLRQIQVTLRHGSQYMPAPWTDDSVVALMVLTRELTIRYPGRPVHLVLFDGDA